MEHRGADVYATECTVSCMIMGEAAEFITGEGRTTSSD